MWRCNVSVEKRKVPPPREKSGLGRYHAVLQCCPRRRSEWTCTRLSSFSVCVAGWVQRRAGVSASGYLGT